NLNLLNSFRIIRRNEFDFKIFDEFFQQRLSKAKLRYLNRYIYCFMCEMKSRRENGNSNSKATSDASVTSSESLKEDALFQQAQRNQLVDRYIRESKLLGLSLKHQDQLSIYKLINDKLIQEQQNYISTTS